MTAADVSPPRFRELLGRFATGVVVLTARNPAGEPVGMTANSLASVSLEPPLVSVCVELQADMHAVLAAGVDFVANVLRHDQEALSRRFAAPEQIRGSRFDGVGYSISPEGLVILDGTLCHIECRPFARHALGDHTLFVGRVTGGAISEGMPLLYYRGGYASLGGR